MIDLLGHALAECRSLSRGVWAASHRLPKLLPSRRGRVARLGNRSAFVRSEEKPGHTIARDVHAGAVEMRGRRLDTSLPPQPQARIDLGNAFADNVLCNLADDPRFCAGRQMIAQDAKATGWRDHDQTARRIFFNSQVQPTGDVPQELTLAIVLDCVMRGPDLMSMIGAVMHGARAAVPPAKRFGSERQFSQFGEREIVIRPCEEAGGIAVCNQHQCRFRCHDNL